MENPQFSLQNIQSLIFSKFIRFFTFLKQQQSYYFSQKMIKQDIPTQQITTSNISQLNNPQLKQPPLQIILQKDTVLNQKFENKQALEKLLSDCLLKIQQMHQEVKKNERLDKYFQKAGTNQKQMIAVIDKLLEDFLEIKASLTKQDTNINIVAEIATFMDKILKKNDLSKMEKNIDKAIWIIEFQSKVICSMEFIMTSLNIPYDITTMKKECFEQVWKRIKFTSFPDLNKIKDGLSFTKRMLAITTSACLNENECQWALSKLMSYSFSYPQYFFATKEGQLRSMLFYRKPTIQLAKQIWNIPQNGMTREFAKLGMKNIDTNVKIYIPIDQTVEPKDISVNDGNSIQVRILYNDSIYFKKTKKKTKFTLCGPATDQEDDLQTIILHIHGGGFLALSSRSMQVYTRRWAIDLKIPVFSIDYRMPPEHKFPTAPNDCLTVYKFLANHIHKYLNVHPKKIIIAGDSAGGNLSFSLTGLIMKQGLPMPHGIYAAYPACCLEKKFSPSKLYAFTDPLLNPPMLLLCLKQYLAEEEKNQTDPRASPIYLTQQYIGGAKGDKRFPLKWPKTIIQVGAQDPLYDDSIRMMQRMVSSGIDCECQVYQNLSHGFLNLQIAIPEAKMTIKDSIKHLRTLLK